MNETIKLVTDEEIAEVARLARVASEATATDVANLYAEGHCKQQLGSLGRTLLPRMAAHLAAFKAAGKAMALAWESSERAAGEEAFGALCDLCGNGPADMVLVPAAELSRLRKVEAEREALSAAINARLRSGCGQ